MLLANSYAEGNLLKIKTMKPALNNWLVTKMRNMRLTKIDSIIKIKYNSNNFVL